MSPYVSTFRLVDCGEYEYLVHCGCITPWLLSFELDFCSVFSDVAFFFLLMVTDGIKHVYR
jgi:hypothetical protein